MFARVFKEVAVELTAAPIAGLARPGGVDDNDPGELLMRHALSGALRELLLDPEVVGLVRSATLLKLKHARQLTAMSYTRVDTKFESHRECDRGPAPA